MRRNYASTGKCLAHKKKGHQMSAVSIPYCEGAHPTPQGVLTNYLNTDEEIKPNQIHV